MLSVHGKQQFILRVRLNLWKRAVGPGPLPLKELVGHRCKLGYSSCHLKLGRWN